MSIITEQDRLDWTQHPVTKELLEQLRESRFEVKESWAKECFAGQSLEQGALQNATALGGVRVLTDLIQQLESYSDVQPEGALA